MNITTACQCIVTLSLVGIAVSTETPEVAASESNLQPVSSRSHGARKPSPPNATDRNGAMSAAPPAVSKPKEAPAPANPAQQIEERVRSGQMEQPIAQGAISERLDQLEGGSSRSSDHTATGHSDR